MAQRLALAAALLSWLPQPEGVLLQNPNARGRRGQWRSTGSYWKPLFNMLEEAVKVFGESPGEEIFSD